MHSTRPKSFYLSCIPLIYCLSITHIIYFCSIYTETIYFSTNITYVMYTVDGKKVYSIKFVLYCIKLA